jgi:ABC-type cobalamin/Fe3+-siderophores transport system ATPase subunit
MAKNKIRIENLKGIKKLDFEIPAGGVHVLTASNGSGKTTLLVCLERLNNTRAFNENFKQHRSWQVDSYDSAKVTYTAKTIPLFLIRIEELLTHCC